MQKYPYLVKHGQAWYVRIVVPPDVVEFLGKSIIKISTQERDIHRAATVAAPVIAGIKKAIQDARDKLKPPVEVRAEQLAQRLHALHGEDAAAFTVTDILAFALKET